MRIDFNLVRWCVVALGLVAGAKADELVWREDELIGRLLESAGVVGTVVIHEVGSSEWIGYNLERARTRYLPASTFKVANSLIGLEENAVSDVEEVLPYGGEPQPFRGWERDMNLRDAIVVSNVPVYQELARRIGLKTMQRAVKALDYGNREIGKVVDRFWLDGPLAISAIEQVDFLTRLVQDQLPVSIAHQATVREITRLETRGDAVLHGKTGWGQREGPDIGWWVGWVKDRDSIIVFALNIDINEREDVGKRREIGEAALGILGVY